VEAAYRAASTQNGPAQSVPTPVALREYLVHEVVGRVLHHLDLFLDDLRFLKDVFRSKERIDKQVGKDIEGARHVLVQRLDGEARTLLGRKSIQMATDRVCLPGNLLRTPVLGPLEHHVLDEMRDAVLLLAFLPRPGSHPDAHGDGADGGHRFSENRETIGENVFVNFRHVEVPLYLKDSVRRVGQAIGGACPAIISTTGLGKRL